MWYLLVVLLVSLSSGHKLKDVHVKANVLAAVRNFFHSQCVFLLHTDEFYNTEYMAEIMQAVAVHMIPITTFTFESLMEYPETCYVYPLYVIPSGNEDTRRGMLELSDSGSLECADAIWLIFLPKSTNLEKFFDDLYIPFNCEFIVATYINEDSLILREIYRVKYDLPLQTISFGYFTISTGEPKWAVSHRQFYQKRNNLQGIAFRAAYREGAAVKSAIDENGSEIVKGFFGELWTTLETHINFTTKYENVGGEGNGAPTSNGTWNGLIGRIASNRTEVAIGALTISQERGLVVDFTVPLLHSRRCVYLKKPKRNEFHWNNFLTPFSEELWFSVGLSLLVITFCLSATYYLVRNHVPFYLTHFGPRESLDYVYTSYVQQGCAAVPESSSCRVVAMVAKLTATVLLAGYSASLVSHLAIHKPVMPFNTLQELLELDYYRVGMPIHSSTYYTFKNTTDNLMTAIWDKLVDHDNLPSSDLEGLGLVCKRPYYVYIGVRSTCRTHLRDVPCQIAAVCRYGDQVQMGMAFAKLSPYLDIINYQLQNIRRAGILQRLRRKWWPSITNEGKKPWESVQWEAVAPIFAIPLLGANLAIFILLLEWCIARRGVKCRTIARRMGNKTHHSSR